MKTKNSFDYELVRVEGGSFAPGNITDKEVEGDSKKNPNRTLNLDSFSIGKYPVTQRLWVEVMENNPSSNKGEDLPVENVNWKDVQIFIEKFNRLTGKKYRLPTEAEWEFAAKGGNMTEGFKYSGSNKAEDVAWFNHNSKGKTNPIGTKNPNELGIFDMSGNVWEWCNDWYDEFYFQICESNNPTGPSHGTYKVARGGGWHGMADDCMVSRRDFSNPDYRDEALGFRLAHT